MAQPPPSIGDISAAEFKLAREELPLPKSRKEIVARFEAILGTGGVQRVVVELGKPIRVDRLVPKDETSLPPPEILPDDVWLALRNTEIKEINALITPGAGPALSALFDGFVELAKVRMRPRTLFVTTKARLRKWLGVSAPFPVDQLYGIDVVEEKEVPLDCVVLAGMSPDPDFPNFIGIRIPVDMPKNGGKQ